MKNSPYTDFIKELDGQKFKSASALEDAVAGVFNKHSDHFALGYSYLDLIDWARNKHWIQRKQDEYVVSVADTANP